MKAKFAYVGIRVKDLQESADFYTKVLGMKMVNRLKIEQTKGEIITLQSGEGFLLELNYYENKSPYNKRYTVGEGLDHLAFEVDDLEKTLKAAKSAGYPIILDVRKEKSRWTYIKDPNGIWVELYEPA